MTSRTSAVTSETLVSTPPPPASFGPVLPECLRAWRKDRFIGIERWETPEAADEALRLFYERRKGGTAPAQDESCHSEEEDAESQMR